MMIFPSGNKNSGPAHPTRRRFLGFVAGAGLTALLLASCAPGDDDDDDDDDDDRRKSKSNSKTKSSGSGKSGGKRR